MTQETRQVVYTPVDVDDAQYSDIPFEKTEEQIEWEKFRDEMKESNEYAKITVYRQPTESTGRPGAKKLTFLFEVGLDEFSYSQLCARLRDEYGSGTYRMQGRDSENKLRFNRGVTIEAPAKPEAEKSGDISVPAVIAEVRHMINESQQQMAEIMRGPLHGSDPIDQMAKMAGAMGAMMQAVMPQQQPQQSLGEQIKEMMLLKKFMGDFDGSNNDSGDGNLMGLLTATVQNIGPILGAALQAGQETGAVNADGIIQPQTGIPNMQPQNPDAPIITEADQALIAQHKMSVTFLLSQAKGGAQPHDVAVWIVDQIEDDEKLTELENFLGRDDAMRLCTLAVPEVAEHLQWFEQFRTFVLSEIAQEFDMYSDDDKPDLTPEADESKQGETVAGDNSTDADAATTSTTGDTPSDT